MTNIVNKPNKRQKTAACIGGGVIGGGWVARFLLHGWDVNVYDPATDAQRKSTIASITNPQGHKSPIFVVNKILLFITLRSDSVIRPFSTSLFIILSRPSFAFDNCFSLWS